MKHWNSDLILPHWISGPIFIHISILIFFFQTVEFWPYFYLHWFSDLILPISISIGIIISSFQTLEFYPCLFNSWNSDLILPDIGILANFFNHCNSELLLPNTGVFILYLCTLVLSSYRSKRWNSSPISISTRTSILFFEKLEF